MPSHSSVARRRTTSADTPSTSTNFDRAAPPDTIRTSRAATPSHSASTETTAAFAAPSTGGARTKLVEVDGVPADVVRRRATEE